MLASIAAIAGRLSAAVQAGALDRMPWLPDQRRYLAADGRIVLFRAGNQWIGKTTAGLADVIWRCLGKHPYQRCAPPPVTWWVICTSWQQSVAIQKKCWELLPKDAIDARTTFDVGNGFNAKNPLVRFRNGSVIYFKTANQDGINFAGATIDGVLWDEPPKSMRLFVESERRTAARGGIVRLTMTPINAPTEWIREMVAQNAITDIHARLTPEAMIPVGRTEPRRTGDGEVCDAAWIERERGRVPAAEAPILIDGEWETRAEGRYFDRFIDLPDSANRPADPDSHVFTFTIDRSEWSGPEAKRRGRWMIGIDHGSRPGRQAAVLVYEESLGAIGHRLWVVDEYRPTGTTTTRDDATAVHAMLRRAGLEWSDLDEVWGDRPTSAPGAVDRKGNRDLADHIARDLGLPHRDALSPFPRSAKRGMGAGAGSVHAGCIYLTDLMLTKHGGWPLLVIHPRCEQLRTSLANWTGDKNEPEKDLIDALRYAAKTRILGRQRTRGVGFTLSAPGAR